MLGFQEFEWTDAVAWKLPWRSGVTLPARMLAMPHCHTQLNPYNLESPWFLLEERDIMSLEDV